MKDSGDGFIQVPLPTAKQLIGIKYKRVEMAAFFLGKIREDMSEAHRLPTTICPLYWVFIVAVQCQQ